MQFAGLRREKSPPRLTVGRGGTRDEPPTFGAAPGGSQWELDEGSAGKTDVSERSHHRSVMTMQVCTSPELHTRRL